MKLTESDYYTAAAADISVEKLEIEGVYIASSISENAEEFFTAIQAAIKLKGIQQNEKDRHSS